MKSQYIAEWKGRVLTVEGEPKQGIWQLTIDGEAVEVDAAMVRPGTWSILWDGHSSTVDIERTSKGFTVAWKENVTAILISPLAHAMASQSQTKAGGAKGQTIEAPIAGKVVKVSVNCGDSVTVGQTVLVLEAMKMENEIQAEAEGTVSQLLVAEQQSVEMGQTLAVIEGPKA